MARYFAEVDANKIVIRVIVADDLAWCEQNLGGTWVETADPYSEVKQDVTYCGPGFGYDDTAPERFAAQWIASGVKDDGSPPRYPAGSTVFYEGRIYRTSIVANDKSPDDSTWVRSAASSLGNK